VAFLARAWQHPPRAAAPAPVISGQPDPDAAGLALFDGLPGIQAFEDFTLNPEAQVALRSCHHHARKGASGWIRPLDGGGSDKRRPGARIVTRGNIAACREGKRQKTYGKAG
jgi:hypothetical protein